MRDVTRAFFLPGRVVGVHFYFVVYELYTPFAVLEAFAKFDVSGKARVRFPEDRGPYCLVDHVVRVLFLYLTKRPANFFCNGLLATRRFISCYVRRRVRFVLERGGPGEYVTRLSNGRVFVWVGGAGRIDRL